MTTKNNPNKQTAEQRDQRILGGIAKYFATEPKVTVGGADYTAATLTNAFQTEMSSNAALDSAKAALAVQVVQNQTLRSDTQKLRSALRAYILGRYGAAAAQVLADFGMKSPKTPAPRTTEQKAASAAKGAATRKARAAAAKAIAAPAPATTAK